MGLCRLGKKKHKVLRDEGVGRWEDGEWIQPEAKEVFIYANVQPALQQYILKFLPEAEREKECVVISSDHWIYTARSGANPQQADILIYRGARWKIMHMIPCSNIGVHCEAVAVREQDSESERIDGEITEYVP